MFRSNTTLPKNAQPVVYTIMFNKGGLGDCIARLTPVKWILANYPHVTLRLLVPDYFADFAAWVFKDEARVIFKKFGELTEGQGFAPGAVIDNDEVCTTMRIHLIDHAFLMMADAQTSGSARNYLQPTPINTDYFKLGSNYVVLTPNFTSPVREWPGKEIEETIRGLSIRGYVPVLLGKKEVNSYITGHSKDFNTEGAVDLRDKTSLIEAHGIISRARALLGVDNGLMHLAGMTPTPIIGGYTSVAPRHRIPIRDKGETRVVAPTVECRFCQTNANFVYGWDFRRCFYGDYKCTMEMSAERFLKEFDKLELAPK